MLAAEELELMREWDGTEENKAKDDVFANDFRALRRTVTNRTP